MKIRVRRNCRLPKILNVDAITLYPFILFRAGHADQTVLNHELVHIQQIETFGFFSFYISYFFEYFCAFVTSLDHKKSYRGISWEEQAFSLQHEHPSLEMILRLDWD